MAARALEPDADVVPTGHAAHASARADVARVATRRRRVRARAPGIAHWHSYPNVRNRRRIYRIYARRATYSSALNAHQ